MNHSHLIHSHLIRSHPWILATTWTLFWAVGTQAQTRTFAEEPEILLGLELDRSPSLTFVDVDRDGDLDVLVANGRHWPQANEVFLNNGRGRFTIGYRLGEMSSTSYVVSASDLDGDGDADVVVANDQAPNMIYTNDGSGRFTLAGALGPEVEPTRDVVLADLNNDDLVDAVVTNRGKENGLYLNSGQGRFSAKRGFGTSQDSTISLAVADVNEDGRPDLVLANRDGQGNAVYLNDSELSFAESREYGTGSDETRAVAVADMNGDGHLDLVTANIGEANGIAFGLGTGRGRADLFGGARRSGPRRRHRHCRCQPRAAERGLFQPWEGQRVRRSPLRRGGKHHLRRRLG